MRDEIRKSLEKVVGKGVVNLEYAEREEFGDYATNVALQLKNKKTEKRKNPREIAEEITEKLRSDKDLAKTVERIEVAGPGFINFSLARRGLVNELQKILKEKEKYGKTELLKGKKYLIEHTSPNTIKTLHIGHVRNNVLGMAVHNLLEAAGTDVKLDAINNDRGIHVMKAVWAYIKYGEGKTPESEGLKPDHFVDKFYLIGVKESEKKEVEEEMRELLRKWEAGDKEVREVWKKLRDWTFEGFKETYHRLGSKHDHQWFESDFYEHGKKMVEEGLKKGVFKKLPDGAILSNLEGYGISDTIVLRADGTSMYHTQDLYLTKLKREKFPSDLYIWDIGPEQELYLKQLFSMCEQLGIGKREDYEHMSYGYVFLKGKGKMSSRAGNVISADWLMDEVVKKAKEIIENSETSRGLSSKEKDIVAEEVGLGAIKYGLLKLARFTDLQFDIDESLSLQGNSGPYLQYTVARTQSVLKKITNYKLPRPRQAKRGGQITNENLELNAEELTLMRAFIHFPEIIEDAAKSYSPNLLCNYLFDLAQKFNAFYQKHRILGDKALGTEFRLALTSATGQILKNGLSLLGIETPERM